MFVLLPVYSFAEDLSGSCFGVIKYDYDYTSMTIIMKQDGNKISGSWEMGRYGSVDTGTLSGQVDGQRIYATVKSKSDCTVECRGRAYIGNRVIDIFGETVKGPDGCSSNSHAILLKIPLAKEDDFFENDLIDEFNDILDSY